MYINLRLSVYFREIFTRFFTFISVRISVVSGVVGEGVSFRYSSGYILLSVLVRSSVGDGVAYNSAERASIEFMIFLLRFYTTSSLLLLHHLHRPVLCAFSAKLYFGLIFTHSSFSVVVHHDFLC